VADGPAATGGGRAATGAFLKLGKGAFGLTVDADADAEGPARKNDMSAEEDLAGAAGFATDFDGAAGLLPGGGDGFLSRAGFLSTEPDGLSVLAASSVLRFLAAVSADSGGKWRLPGSRTCLTYESYWLKAFWMPTAWGTSGTGQYGAGKFADALTLLEGFLQDDLGELANLVIDQIVDRHVGF
jgi:hypothetical protein